jgi:hypothetical protein
MTKFEAYLWIASVALFALLVIEHVFFMQQKKK